MESLSRPFHRKTESFTKKLSFPSPYDDVFAVGAGAGDTPATRVEDYREIFGGYRASCSIPILDLSALEGDGGGRRSSKEKLDYSKIFGGGFGDDDDVAAPYEQVLAKSVGARTPAKTTSPGSYGEKNYSNETPNQASDGMKKYNMFYNRASQGSEDGKNGKTRVAQIRAVPGFTCFIDDNIRKIDGERSRPRLEEHRRPNPEAVAELSKKQSTTGAKESKSQSTYDKFYSVDRTANANGNSFKPRSFELSSPTRDAAYSASNKTEARRMADFTFDCPKSDAFKKAGPGNCSPSFSDEELAADSVAAASAAALRKAVREAEASIRLAKEIMERKKNGFQKLPRPRCKDGLEVKKKRSDNNSIEATRADKVDLSLKEIEEIVSVNEVVRETNGAKSSSHDDGQQAHIPKSERKKARSGKVAPSSILSEENIIADIIVGKENEDKLELFADFSVSEQFPKVVKTCDQETAVLESEHNFGTVMPSVHAQNYGEENRIADNVVAQASGNKLDEQRTEALELEHKSSGVIMLPVHAQICGQKKSISENVSGKANEDKLEQFTDCKALEEFTELVNTDHQKNATLQLEPVHAQNYGEEKSISENVSGKSNKDKLEQFTGCKAPEQFTELVNTDELRTATLQLEPTNSSVIMPPVYAHNYGEKKSIFESVFGKANKDKLEQYTAFKAPEQFTEPLTIVEQRTETLQLEPTYSSVIMPHVHAQNYREENFINESVVGKASEYKLEPIDDFKCLGQFPELLNTDDQRTTSVESEYTNSDVVLPSVPSVHAHKSGQDKVKKSEEGTLELLEGHRKENHRKRKQWKDFEAKSSDIRIAEDEEQNVQDTSQGFGGQENKVETGDVLVHNNCGKEKEQRGDQTLELLEGLSKEVFRKRKQWKDVEENTSDFRIAQDGEQHVYDTVQEEVHLQEKKEKTPDVSIPTYKWEKREKQTEGDTLELLEGHSKETYRKRKQWKDVEGTLNDLKLAEDRENCGHHEQEKEEKNKLKTSLSEELFEKEVVESQEREMNDDFENMKANSSRELDEVQEWVENEKIKECFKEQEKIKSWKGVQEKEETVKHTYKQDDFEKKIKDFSKWVYEVTFGVKRDEDGQNLDKDKGDCDKRLNKQKGSTVVEEPIVNLKQETVSKVTLDVHEAASEELMNHNGTRNAGEKDASYHHLGDSKVAHGLTEEYNDLNFEEDERKSDASQSSFEFKENENELEDFEIVDDLDFEEEVVETLEVFQSCEFNEGDGSGAVGMAYVGERLNCITGQLVEEYIELDDTMTEATDSVLFNNLPGNIVSSPDENSGAKVKHDGNEAEAYSSSASIKKESVYEAEECEKQTNGENNAFVLEQNQTASVQEKWIEMEGTKEASQLPNLFEGKHETRAEEKEWVDIDRTNTSQQPNELKEGKKERGLNEEIKTTQIAEENVNKKSDNEENSTSQSSQKEVKADKVDLERNGETSKSAREREKDRMVVERAIREARERAFAEARERAERAAVERATAEARQRVMAEARQKLEKSNLATKSSTEKASLQARLKSERAAVERATAEARERALEKAKSQKTNNPSSKLDENNGESTERRNARLEMTQRTMERAAKALAEKNMRDLLAQREQAERHRLAETLDAEVRRWSSGKTGNLRALLSTLQYILGPDSGWQPISLTEIVTTNAVKKAYRKATLHVHPDKLQQRGASIQQKYICEKVFDLLKAAWNRFNSEER